MLEVTDDKLGKSSLEYLYREYEKSMLEKRRNFLGLQDNNILRKLQ